MTVEPWPFPLPINTEGQAVVIGPPTCPHCGYGMLASGYCWCHGAAKARRDAAITDAIKTLEGYGYTVVPPTEPS